METLNNQQIHSEEVQDILLDTPEWLTRYSILGVLLFIAVVFVICVSFKYPESVEINVTLTGMNADFKSRLKNSSDYDTSFVGISSLSQAVYGKLADSAIVRLRFPLYADEKSGNINGMILKADSDRIDAVGKIMAFIAIPHQGAIKYKKGIQANGTIIYSRKNIISKIFE